LPHYFLSINQRYRKREKAISLNTPWWIRIYNA